MCLSPITIPNQTKYISLRHRDKFLMQVPCGHCSECSQTQSNQWYYRAFYEWQRVADNCGYVLFDTLTYAPKYLPKLSDYWYFLDKCHDYPCFDRLHLRNFLQSLFNRVKRAGYERNSVRYFLCTEYGADVRFTHRPHIHIVFYVLDKNIDFIWLSRQISDLWIYGRTDGCPYKSKGYVRSHNYLDTTSLLQSRLRTCRYVTKYVQKCCLFQNELDNRISQVMWSAANYVNPIEPEKWLDSEYARRFKLKLLRQVNQFHLQSQHFGENALSEMDFKQIARDGCLWLPDTNKVKIAVPLSTYYKRKLFYDLIEFNGSRYWVINDLGKEYVRIRSNYNHKLLVDKYQCVIAKYNLPIDNVDKLADYVLNCRGVICGDLPPCDSLLDRIDSIDLINYSNCSDKMQFGVRGLSFYWLGDSQQGYLSKKLYGRISLSQFIAKYCYFDDYFEKQLDLVYSKMNIRKDSVQKVYEKKQKLRNLVKYLGY